jgi:hypothetical protein
VYPQSNGCCSQQRCCFKYEGDKNIWNVFEQREALALMGERHGWQRIQKHLECFSLTSSMMFAFGS